MPGALYSSTNMRAAGKGSALMGAAVLERRISFFCTGKHNALSFGVDELHLVEFQFLRIGYFLLSFGILQVKFFPFTGVGVAGIYADLVAVYQSAAHPAGYGYEYNTGEFQPCNYVRGNICIPAYEPANGKKDQVGDVCKGMC